METDIRDRIQKFLTAEGLSPTRFADEIGVQRSSVSHILSGRNNPGFEFIQKILARYKNLNAEWLMMGTGNMTKTMRQGNLFDTEPEKAVPMEANSQILQPEAVKIPEKLINTTEKQTITSNIEEGKKNAVLEKIVFFYSDSTFETYIPPLKQKA
jgi:transcriptional regulator with XRE-family HTH domain